MRKPTLPFSAPRLFLGCWLFVSVQAKAAGPDLIRFNGDVFTSDAARPRAEAIAIRGERIVAVGANEAITKLAGRKTEPIDLQGRVVVRGLRDARPSRHKGTLAPGQPADLLVLSQNNVTVSGTSPPDTKSVLTLVDGKVAFDVGVLRCGASFRSQDLELFYETQGQRPHLLMLSGEPGYPPDCFQVLRALAPHVRLIFLHQRGTGNSDKAKPGGHTIEANVRDLEQFRRHVGLESFMIFGHSRGGMLAQAHALKP